MWDPSRTIQIPHPSRPCEGWAAQLRRVAQFSKLPTAGAPHLDFEMWESTRANPVLAVVLFPPPLFRKPLVEEPLRPSTGHPFWVKRGDAQDGVWIPAGEMQIGDRLLTIDGQWRRITAITPVEHEETVYNFTVAKDHDYFVGETGFLVHNVDCGCNPIFDRRNLYPGSAGPGNPRGLYEVPATGTYSGDRQALLDQIGVPQGGGAGWAAHHVGYDPSTGNMTMQLVDAIVHGFFTHRGGADDYFNATGCKYVP